MDYGVGNIHSVRRAFERVGASLEVQRQPSTAALEAADFLVLPGVGGFVAGARGIAPVRADLRRVLEQGKPCLGVCLGMQLLFDGSEEGPGEGLGLVPGRVARLRHEVLPQVGWNEVEPMRHGKGDALWEGLEAGFHAYYVNSFAPVPARDHEEAVIARSSYGAPFCAAVRRLKTYGVQFHPEKSSAAGLRVIRNFVGLAEAWA